MPSPCTHSDMLTPSLFFPEHLPPSYILCLRSDPRVAELYWVGPGHPSLSRNPAPPSGEGSLIFQSEHMPQAWPLSRAQHGDWRQAGLEPGSQSWAFSCNDWEAVLSSSTPGRRAGGLAQANPQTHLCPKQKVLDFSVRGPNRFLKAGAWGRRVYVT